MYVRLFAAILFLILIVSLYGFLNLIRGYINEEHERIRKSISLLNAFTPLAIIYTIGLVVCILFNVMAK